MAPPRKKPPLKVFNIGYQGRSLPDFCAALVSAGVQTLVDVRAVEWSQRPPFRKGALCDSLATCRIRYVHRKDAGNPFRPKAGDRRDWKACDRRYRAHLAQHPEVVESLAEVVRQSSAALLCYEAGRDECHRGILLDALKKPERSLEIVDL